jgi:hypothetical protein
MKPTEFPEQTIIWAKDQPEYQPLPAYSDEHQTISCWSLSWRERVRLLWSGRLWLHQMNFGRALQPQYLSMDSPFFGQAATDSRLVKQDEAQVESAGV